MTDPIIELSRQRIERGSQSFAAAARILPPSIRADTYMLYSWCRYCDDLLDGQLLGHDDGSTPQASPATLDELRSKTVAACRGEASDPIFIGLQRVVAKHAIPERHPLELLDGMAMDAAGHHYAGLDDTLTYAYHVAGVVGVMMAMIMGVRDRRTLERASDLGIAFQLTNIARDVVPDAHAGRIYLPADWLATANVGPGEIVQKARRPAVHQVVCRLLNVADSYYESARVGIAHLPFRSAWSIAAALRVYRGIGDVVRRRGANAWDTRSRTTALTKLTHLTIAGFDARRAIARKQSGIAVPRNGLWTPSSLGDG